MQGEERGASLTRLFNRVQSNHRQSGSIEQGDRFFRVGESRHVWIVDRVFVPVGHQLPHVVLCRNGEKLERRLLAEQIVLDRGRFARDRRQANGVFTSEFSRRRDDRPRGNVRSTIGG